MKKALTVSAIIVFAVALVGCGARPEVLTEEQLQDQQTKYTAYVNSSVVISATDAQERIESGENVVVVDIRPNVDYALGRIPGAVNIWRGDYGAADGQYPFGGMCGDREQVAQLLGSLGIGPDTTVLMYSGKHNYDSARFFWVLEQFGHSKEQMALIDGGLVGWRAAGFNTDRTSASVTPVSYTFPGSENRAKVAGLEDVKAAIDDPDTIILDTRAWEEFTGETQLRGASRAGRIPGSVWLEYVDAINVGEGRDETFLSADALRELYESKGITPDKKIIAYCQSGVRSAFTTFVLTQLLGYPNVSNYDGSWIEWSLNSDLPIETGEI